jgi:hypothetical protein
MEFQMPRDEGNTRPRKPGLIGEKSNLATVCTIAAIAYALADFAHELIGHGLTARFLGIPIVRVSSVALQTHGSSRLLAANGTIANIIFGLLALLLFYRVRKFNAVRYFLWVFAAINLFEVLDLTTSGILNSGDWAAVIRGWNPAWAWRAGMSLTGILLYVAVVRLTAAAMASLVKSNQIHRGDVSRLVYPAYFSGVVLLTTASAFNPVGAKWILTSGLGASLVLTIGLIRVPALVTKQIGAREGSPRPLLLSWFWIILGFLIAVAFIFILGPGISLSGK